MTKINDAAQKSALERLTELDKVNMMDALMFDTKEYKNGFKQGAKWAFAEIRKQMELCAVNHTKYPFLHLYDFIDRTLCKKK